MKTKTVKRQEILLKLETELKELNNWLIQVNRGREYPVSKTSRMIYLENQILNIKRKL